jgi:hypothetical protein
MTNENVIFEFRDDDGNNYRGVLFAEIDFAAIDKDIDSPVPQPKGFIAGFMAIIWTDKSNIWHMKGRTKFPSGSKMVHSKSYGKESNETLILQDLYKMALHRKKWCKNNSGTVNGIMNIMHENDMIEYEKIVKAKDGEK